MIERIKLSDLIIVDIDGEFKEVRENEEVFPCLLTNFSLYVGKRDGLIKTSLTQEFFEVTEVYGDGVDIDDLTEEEGGKYYARKFKELSEKIDEEKVLKIIYLGLMGADPRFKYDFETFTLKFHDTLEDKLVIYMNILKGLVMKDNNYKKEYERLTSKKREVGEKK